MVLKIKDKFFKTYISAEEISFAVSRIANAINADYQALCPVAIVVLNGSFIFAADLLRSLDIDIEVKFVKLVSYNGVSSTGNVITAIGLDETITNRHVLLIEDIIDTGKTMSEFLPDLIMQKPASLRIATLLFKPSAQKYDIPKIDYLGFNIPNKFVVGYGLDYDGWGRNLPDILQIGE